MGARGTTVGFYQAGTLRRKACHEVPEPVAEPVRPCVSHFESSGNEGAQRGILSQRSEEWSEAWRKWRETRKGKLSERWLVEKEGAGTGGPGRVEVDCGAEEVRPPVPREQSWSEEAAPSQEKEAESAEERTGEGQGRKVVDCGAEDVRPPAPRKQGGAGEAVPLADGEYSVGKAVMTQPGSGGTQQKPPTTDDGRLVAEVSGKPKPGANVEKSVKWADLEDEGDENTNTNSTSKTKDYKMAETPTKSNEDKNSEPSSPADLDEKLEDFANSELENV